MHFSSQIPRPNLANVLAMGGSCSKSIDFSLDGDTVVNAGGTMWQASHRFSLAKTEGQQPVLWLALDAATEQNPGMALNVSACDAMRLSTTEMLLWRGGACTC